MEARRVDGVSYTLDPLTGQWEIDEEGDEGRFFGGSSDSDPTVAIINGRLRLENISVSNLPPFR